MCEQYIYHWVCGQYIYHWMGGQYIYHWMCGQYIYHWVCALYIYHCVGDEVGGAAIGISSLHQTKVKGQSAALDQLLEVAGHLKNETKSSAQYSSLQGLVHGSWKVYPLILINTQKKEKSIPDTISLIAWRKEA